MNTDQEPGDEGSNDLPEAGDLPFLPEVAPTLRGGPPVPAEPALAAHGGVVQPSIPQPTLAVPTLAAQAPPAAAQPAEPPVFDAKAMVESQKHNANPAYGAMPTATPEKLEKIQKIRAKGASKRRRGRVLRWVVLLLLIAGLAVGGWFGYQAYQDSNDQLDADRAAAQADGDSGAAPGALTPLGNQQELLDAIDDVNSGAQPRVGNLIDDARDVVGGVNDDSATDDPATDDPATDDPAVGNPVPTASALTVATVLPDIVLEVGERLPDTSGRETYAVYVDDFSEGDPAAFLEFVQVTSTEPQLAPSAPIFAELPAGEPDQIVISVARDGDTLTRAIINGPAIKLYVDYTP